MLLIDGDGLVYRAAFALETRFYEVDGKVFDTKKALLKYNPELKNYPVSRDVDNIKLLPKIVKACILKWRRQAGITSTKIYLTDTDIENNFRRQMNPEYKLNRKPVLDSEGRNAKKPLYYEEVRNILIDDWDAEVVTGYEADDALTINHRPGTIIASADKDLWQDGGLHLNVTTGELWECKSNPGKLKLGKRREKVVGYGFKWLCAQALLGDDIDNIPGLKGYGPVKVFNLLDKLETKQDIYTAVKKAYEKQERTDLIMNMNMLWMLREEGGYFDEEKI